MERPQCCIDRCLTKTKSIKVKDIIYYLFPTDAEWATKWEKKIKDFDPKYRRRSNDIVCSLHFAKTSMQPVSRQLVDHALPIYFPQKAIDTQNRNTNETIPDSKCCITGCPTKFDDMESKIHGFKFPDGGEQRKKWTFIIELYNNQKIEWNKSMRICALHFSSASLTTDGKLCDGAKPSIFKHAIACRQKEIAKQQTQTTSQQISPAKIQSINVPLHQKNADNHSMSRRSAPIIARRLSLPYSNLPPLIPKPNIMLLKRPNANPANGSNLAKKLQRISLPNGALAAISKTNTNSTSNRPVPGLTKVNIISNRRILPKSNVAVLRKSMPPPQVNKLSPAIVARIDNGMAKLIPVSKPSTAHITRLPPTLKPAPRPLFKAYVKSSPLETQIPKISKIQSIGNVKPVKKLTDNSIPIISKVPDKPATVSKLVDGERRIHDIVVIDDEESEIAKAMKSSEDVDDVNVSAQNKNVNEMQLYSVKDHRAFKFPRTLLERILQKKKENETLNAELIEWRKKYHKMNQQHRLQTATTVEETIEIS